MPEKSLFSALGLARLLRYSYGGLFLLLLTAVVNPQAIAPIVGALGTILAPLAIMAVGAAIYIIHRYVIGELFLYPLLHFFHQGWDLARRRRGVDSTENLTYLGILGVRKEDRRAAYTAARRLLFDSETRDHLDIAHSELHILWITVDETLVAAVYLQASGHGPTLLFLISAAVGVCAAIAEVRQHQMECHMLKTAEHEGRLRPFLKQMGYD